MVDCLLLDKLFKICLSLEKSLELIAVKLVSSKIPLKFNKS